MALKSSMKILLADESPGNRQYTKKMLTNMGFKNIIEAGDINKVFSRIEESDEKDPVQFIICDWDLPGGGGLELLKQIRAGEKTKKIRFLMVNSEAAQQNVVLAVKSGVNNVIVRPYSSNLLMEKISKIFKQS